MKTYPITVKRSTYRGNDKRKRQQAAEYSRDAVILENYCNALLEQQDQPVQVYEWADLARGCNLSVDRVAELGYSIDGGSNGFTAVRKGLTLDQAFAQAEKDL